MGFHCDNMVAKRYEIYLQVFDIDIDIDLNTRTEIYINTFETSITPVHIMSTIKKQIRSIMLCKSVVQETY